MITRIWPGKPYPLGATWDGQGVNFALFSEHATRVEVCLFDDAGATVESQRITLPEQTDYVWHAYIPDLVPGQCYGYRVHGPYTPERGLRFNPNKLLVDPYAKALSGQIQWADALFGYTVGEDDNTLDERDSAPFIPRSVVVDGSFDWGDDKLLCTPLHQSVIYELHVKGFTRLHPEVPEQLRGTYAGLAEPSVIAYLQSLGVTAVELLPVHQTIDDREVHNRDLHNYWGYNTLGFFAPDSRFSSSGEGGEQVNEFKAMVKALHTAGIEVILDVVYNHTCEGSHLGPTLSFKGVDNPVYYRLVEHDPRYFMDYTGCGNSLNMLESRSLQLIMDSLRYWVNEMHIDGFRFDLATTLGRGLHEHDRSSAFFDIIHQDPVLSQVKLIAEPWDVGPGGYQVGNFPVLWAEWNGKYRDLARRFWKGDDIPVAHMGFRLAGSPDLYQRNGRRPAASINFITAHDGFTLRDMVSYNRKHNSANGEDNRDGENHNNSWNCGVEGPTNDLEINELRSRQQRNLLATLMLSQGVPMLLAGDERNRSQGGNNNTYCQDNAINWLDWKLDEPGEELLDFTRQLIQIRREHPALRRRKFFQGRSIHGEQVHDIEWFRSDGTEFDDEAWFRDSAHCLGMLLNGQVMREWDERGEFIHDDMLLLLLNSSTEDDAFTLPRASDGAAWEVLIDTATSTGTNFTTTSPGAAYKLRGQSLVLLRQRSQ